MKGEMHERKNLPSFFTCKFPLLTVPKLSESVKLLSLKVQ